MPRTDLPKDIQTKYWQPTVDSTVHPHQGQTIVTFTFEDRNAWSNKPGDRVLISTADLIRLDYVAQDHQKTRQILGCGDGCLLEKKTSFMASQRMSELSRARCEARDVMARLNSLYISPGLRSETVTPGDAEFRAHQEDRIRGLEAELKRDEQRKESLRKEVERERMARLQVERDLAACQKALVSIEREKNRAQDDAAECRVLRDANRALGSANNILSRQVEELKEMRDAQRAQVEELQKQAPFKATRFAEVRMLVAVCRNCSRPTDIATLHSNKNQCLDCIPF